MRAPAYEARLCSATGAMVGLASGVLRTVGRGGRGVPVCAAVGAPTTSLSVTGVCIPAFEFRDVRRRHPRSMRARGRARGRPGQSVAPDRRCARGSPTPALGDPGCPRVRACEWHCALHWAPEGDAPQPTVKDLHPARGLRPRGYVPKGSASGMRQANAPPGRPLFNGGGGVQEVPGAVTMAVAGDSQTGWGQLLAVGGAVAGGWGASKGMRQGVVGPLGNPPLPLSKGLPPGRPLRWHTVMV